MGVSAAGLGADDEEAERLSVEALARLVREACDAFDETEESVAQEAEVSAPSDGPESTLDE